MALISRATVSVARLNSQHNASLLNPQMAVRIDCLELCFQHFLELKADDTFYGTFYGTFYYNATTSRVLSPNSFETVVMNRLCMCPAFSWTSEF
ncbi:hypothetical protein BPOR_0136g00120 [Botrytis porri]|uniref:Uncharacterized protein n=1 Tax=Botrytis porri TaxID=87229 RepID=A0A4Z1KWH9_9HELO|nr:hypothetical protein BPOR_0136g00120 [Botrytis porri]